MKSWNISFILTLLAGTEGISKEVKNLWMETLRMLRAVLPHCNAEFVLLSPAVVTLCQCITTTSSASLKTSALLVVPTLVKLLTPGKCDGGFLIFLRQSNDQVIINKYFNITKKAQF